MKRFLILLLTLLVSLSLTGLAEGVRVYNYEEILVDGDYVLTDDFDLTYGDTYSSPEEVALYLHVFCELPVNFLTKSEARAMGWVSSEGNLWEVADGMSIGGDVFGNREGLLPDADGRTWFECDVNYEGGYRQGERLLFSDDGLICYSGDHYKSYTLLYDAWYDDIDAEWDEAA